jgi:glycosyltransferase involved in cell wall biosynthesis
VTIAMPTYNRVELLQRAVRSVLDQTVSDVELIIHDNCSADGTEGWATNLAATDERVVYVRNAENIGHWRNQTKALHSGTAPLVGLMWDDEVMDPTNLERKLAVLDAHPEVGAAHSAIHVRREDGSLVSDWVLWDVPDRPIVIEQPHEFVRRSYRYPARMVVGSIVMRRSITAGLGLFQEHAPSDDHMLFLRIGSRGPTAYLRDALTSVEVNGGISASTAYQVAIDGHLAPTLKFVNGANKVMDMFMDEYRPPLTERLGLRAQQRIWNHATLAHMVGVHHPHLQPRGSVARMLRDIAKTDPTALLNPAFYLAARRASL